MIPKADIIAMQRVNQKEITPHKPITSVYAIESPLKNASPRIELTPRSQAIALQHFRRHPSWLERNAVIAVAIIEPPVLEKKAPLVFQTTIQGGARERRQVIEGGDVKSVFSCEPHGVPKTLRRIPVITE